MADTDTDAFQPTAGAESPKISISAQYVKDLSFENPNALNNLRNQAVPPEINVSVDVQATNIGENVYEVALRIQASANRDDEVVFVVELVYGAAFSFQNIPAENHELVCLVECPRLIFPYARRVVSDVVVDGGFPPLFLEPIDFVELFRRHKMADSVAASGSVPESGPGTGPESPAAT